MNHDAFIREVALMRTLHREFFRTRSEDQKPDLLRRAKMAERNVDRMIDEWKQGQGSLFGEDE